MSISATDRLSSTHRLSFPHIAVAVLTALALFAVLVAISVSNDRVTTSSSTAPWSGGTPGPGRATSGYIRDPTPRALLLVNTPAASEAAPGPGVK